MKARIYAAIGRFLIRVGFLATPEEDAYYAWADERLDYLAAEAAHPYATCWQTDPTCKRVVCTARRSG